MILGGRGEAVWDWGARLCRAWQGSTLFGVVKCLIRVLPSLKPDFVVQRGETGERRCACRGKDPNTCMVPQNLLSQSHEAMLTSSFKKSGA